MSCHRERARRAPPQLEPMTRETEGVDHAGCGFARTDYWRSIQYNLLDAEPCADYLRNQECWHKFDRMSSYCQKLVTQVSGGVFG